MHGHCHVVETHGANCSDTQTGSPMARPLRIRQVPRPKATRMPCSTITNWARNNVRHGFLLSHLTSIDLSDMLMLVFTTAILGRQPMMFWSTRTRRTLSGCGVPRLPRLTAAISCFLYAETRRECVYFGMLCVGSRVLTDRVASLVTEKSVMDSGPPERHHWSEHGVGQAHR